MDDFESPYLRFFNELRRMCPGGKVSEAELRKAFLPLRCGKGGFFVFEGEIPDKEIYCVQFCTNQGNTLYIADLALK